MVKQIQKSKIKKICIFILFYAINVILYAHSLIELADFALVNNSDILSAYNSYQSTIISSKTIDGAFSPQLSFSSSSQIAKDYSWKSCPDYLSSSISYAQPLPGGSSIGISIGASVNKESICEELYLSQNPNLSISFQQSLMPFWMQGKSKDPYIENVNQQKKYYYYEYLNTKKTVLINVAQNFVNMLIYKKQIEISKNSINLLDEQIEAVKQLKVSGASSQSKITEYLNSKWSSQQDLLNVQANLESSIQNLKVLCNCDIYVLDNDCLNFFSLSTDDYLSVIATATDRICDPLEANYQLKLEMLKNKIVIDKQTSAPELSILVQPSWSMGIKKENEWKEAWKEMNVPSNWSATVGINLTPLFSATNKQNKKKYELDFDTLEKSFNSYKFQKKYLQEQYKQLYEQYQNQKKEITKLYNEEQIEFLDLKKQYEIGVISRIDYETIKVRMKNCYLNLQITELYVWLYDFLVKVNQ